MCVLLYFFLRRKNHGISHMAVERILQLLFFESSIHSIYLTGNLVVRCNCTASPTAVSAHFYNFQVDRYLVLVFQFEKCSDPQEYRIF